jgi:hypothetical protein
MAMSERDARRVAPFRHLWKTDDKAWMKQRREDWKLIEAGYYQGETKKSIAQNKKFFVAGEKDAYIPWTALYFSVPITSPDEARQLFYSELFGPTERNDVATRYLRIASDMGQGIPWLRQHLQYFVDGVLGHEYRYLEETIPNGLKKMVSPEPSFWCGGCMSWMVKLLSGTIEYHGCMEAVDYFVSVLAHADDPKFRYRKDFDELMRLIDEVAADGSAPELARELAGKLQARKQEISDNWALHAHLDKNG